MWGQRGLHGLLRESVSQLTHRVVATAPYVPRLLDLDELLLPGRVQLVPLPRLEQPPAQFPKIRLALLGDVPVAALVVSVHVSAMDCGAATLGERQNVSRAFAGDEERYYPIYSNAKLKTEICRFDLCHRCFASSDV